MLITCTNCRVGQKRGFYKRHELSECITNLIKGNDELDDKIKQRRIEVLTSNVRNRRTHRRNEWSIRGRMEDLRERVRIEQSNITERRRIRGEIQNELINYR